MADDVIDPDEPEEIDPDDDEALQEMFQQMNDYKLANLYIANASSEELAKHLAGITEIHRTHRELLYTLAMVVERQPKMVSHMPKILRDMAEAFDSLLEMSDKYAEEDEAA